MKKATNKQIKELERVAAMPDAQIDTSDIPEIKDWGGAVRGRFAPQETHPISIRVSKADLSHAREIAERKGLSYQTYIKSLLHEGIERDRSRQ